MTEKETLPNLTNAERADQIKRIMSAFEREFNKKTSNPDSFATLHDIEKMWGHLRTDTDKIYSDMVQDMMGRIDEADLIRKKKRI